MMNGFAAETQRAGVDKFDVAPFAARGEEVKILK
jgi:hypothetical protein